MMADSRDIVGVLFALERHAAGSDESTTPVRGVDVLDADDASRAGRVDELIVGDEDADVRRAARGATGVAGAGAGAAGAGDDEPAGVGKGRGRFAPLEAHADASAAAVSAMRTFIGILELSARPNTIRSGPVN